MLLGSLQSKSEVEKAEEEDIFVMHSIGYFDYTQVLMYHNSKF